LRIKSGKPDEVILASDTSCRHQILDGTKREAKHVVEVLNDSIKK
jgi:Fe-S oxidoreductase